MLHSRIFSSLEESSLLINLTHTRAFVRLLTFGVRVRRYQELVAFEGPPRVDQLPTAHLPGSVSNSLFLSRKLIKSGALPCLAMVLQKGSRRGVSAV